MNSEINPNVGATYAADVLVKEEAKHATTIKQKVLRLYGCVMLAAGLGFGAELPDRNTGTERIITVGHGEYQGNYSVEDVEEVVQQPAGTISLAELVERIKNPPVSLYDLAQQAIEKAAADDAVAAQAAIAVVSQKPVSTTHSTYTPPTSVAESVKTPSTKPSITTIPPATHDKAPPTYENFEKLSETCEAPEDGWQANTGNGYYGGLQFSLESWEWVGGPGFPHEADKDEQIYRAQLLHAELGWEAWPACSLQLGFR